VVPNWLRQEHAAFGDAYARHLVLVRALHATCRVKFGSILGDDVSLKLRSPSSSIYFRQDLFIASGRPSLPASEFAVPQSPLSQLLTGWEPWNVQPLPVSLIARNNWSGSFYSEIGRLGVNIASAVADPLLVSRWEPPWLALNLKVSRFLL
jgi:hypothetical protein